MENASTHKVNHIPPSTLPITPAHSLHTTQTFLFQPQPKQNTIPSIIKIQPNPHQTTSTLPISTPPKSSTKNGKPRHSRRSKPPFPGYSQSTKTISSTMKKQKEIQKLKTPPPSKLQSNLRNAAATFGTSSDQYLSVLAMVDAYSTASFRNPTNPSKAQELPRGEGVPPKNDAKKNKKKTGADDVSRRTGGFSNLAFRPK